MRWVRRKGNEEGSAGGREGDWRGAGPAEEREKELIQKQEQWEAPNGVANDRRVRTDPRRARGSRQAQRPALANAQNRSATRRRQETRERRSAQAPKRRKPPLWKIVGGRGRCFLFSRAHSARRTTTKTMFPLNARLPYANEVAARVLVKRSIFLRASAISFALR